MLAVYRDPAGVNHVADDDEEDRDDGNEPEEQAHLVEHVEGVVEEEGVEDHQEPEEHDVDEVVHELEVVLQNVIHVDLLLLFHLLDVEVVDVEVEGLELGRGVPELVNPIRGLDRLEADV